MGDLISRKAVLEIIFPRLNSSKIGSLENQRLYSISKEVKNMPTAFDLESVIAELEGNSKYMQSEANDLASVGDYGTATKLEGMSQAYKDCVNILKSAANTTNGKIGGRGNDI